MFKRKHNLKPTPSEILHDAVQTTNDVRRNGEAADTRLQQMEEELAKLRRQVSPLTDVLIGSAERPVHS